MENHVETLSGFPVLIAIVVCVIVLVFGYFLGKRNQDQIVKTQRPRTEVPVQEKRKESQKARKRASEPHWTNRGKQQQHFAHPWHLTTFKGHTGQVLDIDFSSNGKYLASCSDGDNTTEDSGTSSGTTSSSEGNKENEPKNSNSNPRKPLSRRQKKNRRSADSSPTNKPKKPEISPPKPPSKREKVKEKSSENGFKPISIREDQFYALLHEFVVLPDQMFSLGFPSEFDNKVCIMKQQFAPQVKYYAKKNQISDSESSSSDEGDRTHRGAIERTCARCANGFFATKTEYLTTERCQYHWGKVRFQEEDGHYQQLYTCCKQPPGAHGCTVGRLHVWNGLSAGLNSPLEGYVKTKPSLKKSYGSYGIYALDCEMCYTLNGLELCKVTVVDIYGTIVYNEFVRPDTQVVDFNTRFSGVTEKDVSGKWVKKLKDVQRDLLNIFNDRTILIGHALENDLRALKILHSRIVDTSLSFPHDRGYPFRHSLKHLVSLHLSKEIQSGIGHDSYEDANSCMELMLWKIRSQFYSIP